MSEKEWYFFCIRGRKYRNSIRPNRVTGSGFWKATGIDKPIFSTVKEPNHQECIGLKKSLVYYRGSAGKGTKTDWMMHEFRLPLDSNLNNSHLSDDHHPYLAHDAEVWTLCRIFKRISSYRKYTPTNMKNSNNNNNPTDLTITIQNPNNDHQWSCKTSSSLESEICEPGFAASFSDSVIHLEDEAKPVGFDDQRNSFLNPNLSHGVGFEASDSTSFWNGINGGGDDDLFTNGGWDELRPVVQFAAFDPSRIYGCI